MVPYNTFHVPAYIFPMATMQHGAGSGATLTAAGAATVIGATVAFVGGSILLFRYLDRHPELALKIMNFPSEIADIPRVWREAGEEVKNAPKVEHKSILQIWREAGKVAAQKRVAAHV